MNYKDYILTELERNKRNAALYTRMISLAFDGDRDEIIIRHHLTFERNHELDTVNEIPSADTLIFDHEAMGRIFGTQSVPIMAYLATLPVADGSRDRQLEIYVSQREHAGMGSFHPLPAVTEEPAVPGQFIG